MKGDYLLMKRNTFLRALCVALCAALLLGTFAISFSAVDADEEEIIEAVVADEAPAAAPVAQAESAPNVFARVFDWFFRTFGFIGFTLDPYQFTIINQKPTFQWLLGFNDFYDTMPWVVNVWADSFKTQFNYDNRDWRIQFWKGGYGVFFATGGEIGIYVKSESANVQHYGAPSDTKDWLDLSYTIYNRGKKLFTRPSPKLSGDVGPYWWATGYKILSICTDFYSSPRKNVIMDATLNLKNATMRDAFLAQLERNGFSELTSGSLGLDTPEKYVKMADGASVRFIWRNVNKSIY